MRHLLCKTLNASLPARCIMACSHACTAGAACLWQPRRPFCQLQHCLDCRGEGMLYDTDQAERMRTSCRMLQVECHFRESDLKGKHVVKSQDACRLTDARQGLTGVLRMKSVRPCFIPPQRREGPLNNCCPGPAGQPAAAKSALHRPQPCPSIGPVACLFRSYAVRAATRPGSDAPPLPTFDHGVGHLLPLL